MKLLIFVLANASAFFFSYRYTPERVRALLGEHQLEVLDQWITMSEEEGVFLCRRLGAAR